MDKFRVQHKNLRIFQISNVIYSTDLVVRQDGEDPGHLGLLRHLGLTPDHARLRPVSCDPLSLDYGPRGCFLGWLLLLR